MPPGGLKSGAGRRQEFHYIIDGKKYNNLDDAAKACGVSKQTIHSWCNNKKKPDCVKEALRSKNILNPRVSLKTKSKGKSPKKAKDKSRTKLKTDAKDKNLPSDILDEAASANMTPLDYMLSIMKDTEENSDRRDKMAYWAAPYCHGKGIEKIGKKEKQQDKAKETAGGKLSTGRPPALTRVK